MKQLIMRITQVYETVKHNGISSLLNQIFYFDRIAVVVERDLLEIAVNKQNSYSSDVEVVELNQEILDTKNFFYPLRNRYMKAVHYFENGYGCCALVRNEEIIGDIWFAIPVKNSLSTCHADCKWLQIKCAEDQAYTFDMFLNPAERGNNLATLLQTSALTTLRKKGYSKAYGYYWNDNMPALWVHRIGKWTEMKRLKVNRFLFFKKVLS